MSTNTLTDAAIATTCSALLLYFGGRPAFSALRAALFWGRTEGTVTASYRFFSTDRRPESNRLSGVRGISGLTKGEKFYFYIVEYAYSADGTAYTNDRRMFTNRLKSWDVYWTASRMERKYPVGRKVVVYYDPAKPSSAVISLWLSVSDYFLAALGLFAFSACIFGLLRMAYHSLAVALGG